MKLSILNDKIEEIEKYIQELLEITPPNYEVYISDFKTKASCERYFEKIICAVIDLVFLIIKDSELQMPEDEESTFDILSNHEIIPKELAKKLKEAKGMRNIIAHEYGKIDDEIVFEAITKQLEKDIKEFVDIIKKRVKRN